MEAVQLLLIEDSEDDAILVVKRLRRAGLTLDYRRVETAEAMAAELDRSPPDLVISDNSMPRFNAEAALTLLRRTGLDIPFIVVSGQIGEESAAALMRAGAQDFVLKDSLSRLAPAAHRELRDARERHERRQAEAALHTAEERFRLIAEHLSDVVVKYRLTPAPEVEYISPGIAELNGHHPDVLYERPERIFDAVHPDDIEEERRAWLSPPPQPFLTRWRRPDGTEAWIEHRLVAVHPAAADAPVAVEGILRDVTTQIQAAHEREELARQLHQAERLDSLGQLAGGIAHDFNNLLHVITGYADFILDELGPAHPCSRDADAIADAARRGAALTRQLLIFTRLQPSDPQLVDVNAVIADVERLLRRTLGEDIDFVIDPDPTINCVTIDPSRLEQLIMNLVVNARAAMPTGGELTISTASLGGRSVRITVTDTGCGMTPDVQRRAFEPFFTTKGAGNGSGLGLATVYGVVREASGTITLFSESGRGTRFTIDLPTTDQPTIALPHTTAATAIGGADEHILLIEDDPRVRETTRRLLHNRNYRVTDVPTRDDALEVIRNEHNQVDLCLCDVVMPGLAAPEFIELFHARLPATPIVFMSGYPAEDRGSRNLPDDIPILAKPVDAITLLRTIRTAIDRAPTDSSPTRAPADVSARLASLPDPAVATLSGS